MVRLVDLLSGLSRTGDLGFGLQPGEAVRSAALALLLGDSIEVPDEDARAGLYAALLLHVGCIGYSHEIADRFGDDLAWNRAAARTNVVDSKDVFRTFLPTFTRGRPPLARLGLVITAMAHGRRATTEYETAACEVGGDIARRLDLPDEVQRAVRHSYERWNGEGVPEGLSGEDIPIGSRLAVVACVASVFDTIGGPEAAAGIIGAQAGSILDPEVATHFVERAPSLLAVVDISDPRDRILRSEPDPPLLVPEARLVEVAAAFGDLADLKTPFTHGHSRGCADLARRAGAHLAISGSDLTDLVLAGHLHDVGSVAVSNAIWEKPGPLSVHEWEQVRLHAYHSERILTGSDRLASLAPLVGMHHERLDGQGYHRGCGRGELSASARVLAAADAYQAMGQDRPHRPALSRDEAERELLADARRGVLDVDAVNAVLAVAGHEATARRALPAGISDREAEVLALVAEGCTNAQIAQRLVISRRTAEHHVQHIYTKIGASSRAAAAMFAMENGLVELASRE